MRNANGSKLERRVAMKKTPSTIFGKEKGEIEAELQRSKLRGIKTPKPQKLGTNRSKSLGISPSEVGEMKYLLTGPTSLLPGFDGWDVY
jgi:hypothetical protein